jgi:pilus assembly protein Flp/PilA
MFSKLRDSALTLYVNAKVFLSDERGQDLIEYAIIVAVIAVAAVSASTSLSNIINTAFTTMNTKVQDAM